MKKFGVVWLALALLVQGAWAEEVVGTVSGVISGSVVKVETPAGEKVFGLPGVEIEDRSAGKAFTEKLLQGKKVTLLVDRVSPRGFMYGDIRLEDGALLSSLLQKEGFIPGDVEEAPAPLPISNDKAEVDRMRQASQTYARERKAQWESLSKEQREEVLRARQQISVGIRRRQDAAKAWMAQQRAEEQRRQEDLLADQQAILEQSYLGGETQYYDFYDPQAEAEAARREYLWQHYGVPLGISTTTYRSPNSNIEVTSPIIPDGLGSYY